MAAGGVGLRRRVLAGRIAEHAAHRFQFLHAVVADLAAAFEERAHCCPRGRADDEVDVGQVDALGPQPGEKSALPSHSDRSTAAEYQRRAHLCLLCEMPVAAVSGASGAVDSPPSETRWTALSFPRLVAFTFTAGGRRLVTDALATTAWNLGWQRDSTGLR